MRKKVFILTAGILMVYAGAVTMLAGAAVVAQEVRK